VVNFILSIELGSPGMNDTDDISRALRDLAGQIDEKFGVSLPLPFRIPVSDRNGNAVGEARLTD
jgi:hypothetical protein